MEKDRTTEFAERFAKLRMDLRMSQDKFADFLGISRPTVGFYENGKRQPDAFVLKQIAERCGVSADYLLGLPNAKPSEYAGFTPENIQWLRTLPDLAALNEIMGSEHFRTLVESLCRKRGKSK